MKFNLKNNSLILKYLKKYNIECGDCEDGHVVYDLMFRGTSISSILMEVTSIFEDLSLNTKEKKQLRLESLSFSFIKKVVNSQYQLSSSLTAKINTLASHLCHKKKSEDNDPVFISTGSEQCRRTWKREVLVKFNSMFLHLKETPQELSLDLIKIICSYLSKTISSSDEFEALTRASSIQSNSKEKTLNFRTGLSALIDDSGTEIQIKLTSFMATVGSDFIKSCGFRYISAAIKETNVDLEPAQQKTSTSIIAEHEHLFLYNQKELLFIGEILLNFLKKTDFLDIRRTGLDTTPAEYFTLDKMPVYTVVFSAELLKSLFYLTPYDATLPMIVKPLKWRNKPVIKDKSSGTVPDKLRQEHAQQELTMGGFLFNKNLNYPAIQVRTPDTCSYICETNIDNLNYVQETCFEINKAHLNFVRSHFNTLLRNYLRSVDLDSKNILFFESDKLRISSYSEFISLLLNKKDENSELNLSDTISNSLARFHNNRYARVIDVVLNFIFILELATLYKEEDLYFKFFLCWRGRIYAQSFPLSPQGISLSKFLLKFKNETETTVSSLHEEMDRLLKVHPTKDIFKQLLESPLLQTASYDASCSGISILAALIGDQELLLQTNVLSLEENVAVKQDLYGIIQSKIKAFLNLDLDKLKSKIGLSNDILDSTSHLKQRVECFIRALDRENVKLLVMCWAYSEGPFSRNKKISSWYYCKKKYEEVLCGETTLCNFESAIIKYLSNCFSDFMSKELTKFTSLLLKEFKTALTSNPKRAHFIVCSGSTRSFYCMVNYYKQKKTQVVSYINGNKYKLVVKEDTDLVDTNRCLRGLIPNFIHSLDALLLNDTIEKLKLLQIPVVVSHDCFRVERKYEHVVKNAYFSAMNRRLLTDNTVLKSFLRLNRVNTTFESLINWSNPLHEYYENKMLILAYLKAGHLFASTKILT